MIAEGSKVGSKAVEKMNGVRSMRAAGDGGEEESELVLPNLADDELGRIVENWIGGWKNFDAVRART